jgi:hypothetical protein
MVMKRLALLLFLPILSFAQTGTTTQTQNAGGGVSSSSQVIALFTGCSGTQYLGADGACHTASGSGTVTSFSAGTLSPLFTTSVATATSTPALSFTLTNAAQNSVFAGPATGGAGAPSYQTAPTISAANMSSFPTFNQNTTGTAGGLTGTPAITVGNITSNGTLSGTAFSSYLASPPAIGGTTAAAGTFSALTDTGMTGGPFCVHETSGVLSATASDCGSGGSLSFPLTVSGTTTSGHLAYFSNATTYSNDANLDDGATTANTLTYSASGGFAATGGPVSSTGPAGDAGMIYLDGNTTNQTIPANKFALGGFNSTSATAYGWQPSTTAPSGTQFMMAGTPSTGWSAVTYESTVTAGQGGTGVANTATLTLGTSNQNWATLGTGIVKNTTTTGALSDAAASDVYGLFTSCTGSSGFFLKDGGTCAAPGSAFPVTVSGTVTSGGIPYFNSTTQESSSAILNTNILVKGGGAGGAPTNSSITDNGTTISSTEPLALGTATCTTFGTAGGICPTEGTAPTNVSGAAPLYPDATAHEYLAATNGSSSFGMMVRRQPGAIHATAQTAAISIATLCAASAGACNVAGQYHIHWNFTQGGTACTVVTAGSVTFLLTWTDTNAVSHSAIAMPMFNSVSNIATSGSFTFTTSNATAYASGDFNISTNGSVIQYATGYTACTTGTGTYQLDAVVTRLQ